MVALLLLAFGAVLVVAGTALYDPRAAVIVAGVGLVAAARNLSRSTEAS